MTQTKESESSRLVPGSTGQSRWSVIITLMFTTIALSVGVINFNRYLMTGNRFHYPAALVLIHMVFCTVLTATLRVFASDLFPSLTGQRRITVDGQLFVRAVLPIACCFATSLICANVSYSLLSLAFLQMLKETGVITTYVLSLMAGLETFSVQHVQIIMCALIGACLSIKGEMHFAFVGFVIQMTSQFADCSRLVLQGVVLSGQRLDAMSYLLLVSPVCGMLLGVIICCLVQLLPNGVPAGMAWPSTAVLHAWAPVILANCIAAFLLNVSATMLMLRSGPMMYVFTGVLKDITVVFSSVRFVNEIITPLQWVAFTIQILSVFAWAMLKNGTEIADYAQCVRGVFGLPHAVELPSAEAVKGQATAATLVDAEAAWDTTCTESPRKKVA